MACVRTAWIYARTGQCWWWLTFCSGGATVVFTGSEESADDRMVRMVLEHVGVYDHPCTRSQVILREQGGWHGTRERERDIGCARMRQKKPFLVWSQCLTMPLAEREGKDPVEKMPSTFKEAQTFLSKRKSASNKWIVLSVSSQPKHSDSWHVIWMSSDASRLCMHERPRKESTVLTVFVQRKSGLKGSTATKKAAEISMKGAGLIKPETKIVQLAMSKGMRTRAVQVCHGMNVCTYRIVNQKGTRIIIFVQHFHFLELSCMKPLSKSMTWDRRLLKSSMIEGHDM